MILETIVEEIEKSGESRYKISCDTGVDASVLHRVVNGGSCSIETADTLCEYLGLELRARRQRKGKQ